MQAKTQGCQLLFECSFVSPHAHSIPGARKCFNAVCAAKVRQRWRNFSNPSSSQESSGDWMDCCSKRADYTNKKETQLRLLQFRALQNYRNSNSALLPRADIGFFEIQDKNC